MTLKPDTSHDALRLVAVLVERLGGRVVIPCYEMVENDTKTITVEPTIDGGVVIQCQR